MMWIFLTRSKSLPLDIVCLFLQTFGRDQNVGGFIRCNQSGELARSHALVDMALTEFGYKVEPTGANSPSQNKQAEKWNNTFAITTHALLYGVASEQKYWSAALLHAVYLHNPLLQVFHDLSLSQPALCILLFARPEPHTVYPTKVSPCFVVTKYHN
jgi:hypothetical protein